MRKAYLGGSQPWQVAFSGGKDSTVALALVYEMLEAIPKHLRRKTYVVATDTKVENPFIARFMSEVIDAINTAPASKELGIEAILTKPSIEKSFFTLLIGRGYPSPTRNFRWCTDRLKIAPSEATTKMIVQRHGSCVIVLGTRRSESTNRAHAMDSRAYNELGFNLSNYVHDTYLYSPIANFSTDDIWSYLTTHNPPPWGKSHKELFSLYTIASGNECEFIIDKNQSSCGGNYSGLFGGLRAWLKPIASAS